MDNKYFKRNAEWRNGSDLQKQMIENQYYSDFRKYIELKNGGVKLPSWKEFYNRLEIYRNCNFDDEKFWLKLNDEKEKTILDLQITHLLKETNNQNVTINELKSIIKSFQNSIDRLEKIEENRQKFWKRITPIFCLLFFILNYNLIKIDENYFLKLWDFCLVIVDFDIIKYKINKFVNLSQNIFLKFYNWFYELE